MSDKPKILSMDDDPFIQAMIEEALSDSYSVISASSGAEALSLVQSGAPPDLVISDVEMPGMDGYETVRQMKALPQMADIPVLFLSGKDEIEDKLKGFEAGGDAYMTKPFDLLEVEAKVKNLLAWSLERRQLKQSLSFASSTAMTAMASMGEMGQVLNGLKAINACIKADALAQALLAALFLFDLKGTVQLRWGQQLLNTTSQGPASALEESVINHMATMERIFHFKSRMSINYEHVTLLVNNMPVFDEDRCGRLRDHLAILVEAAESRLKGIAASEESYARGALLTQVAEQITAALAEIDEAQRRSRFHSNQALNEAMSLVESALVRVALSEQQERDLVAVIRKGFDRVDKAQAVEADVQNQLSALVQTLNTAVKGQARI